MIKAEARQVAAIVASADGYCTACVGDLAEKLKKEFPEYDWDLMIGEATDAYFKEGEES